MNLLDSLLTAWQVPPSEYADMLDTWKRLNSTLGQGPANALRVDEISPRDLGVHSAISIGGAHDDLPVYIPRDFDDHQPAVPPPANVVTQLPPITGVAIVPGGIRSEADTPDDVAAGEFGLKRMWRTVRSVAVMIVAALAVSCDASAGPQGNAHLPAKTTSYPLHTGIVATTFWVGEIFDPTAPDGSQVYSTYDSQWRAHYGGCDGVTVQGSCQTERRTAANNYFPTTMSPRQNPFYLDLPFDDVNNSAAFHQRGRVVPWAHDPVYTGDITDPAVSLMKNRWVQLRHSGHVCYGQIEDAGPGDYDDAGYVFGTDDARPANARFNHAGLDVSPALNGCLAFADLNGENDMVDWRFVDEVDVPAGPWRKVLTSSGVS